MMYLFILFSAGANSFGFYAVNVFRQTFAGLNPHCGAIAVGFVQLLAAMLSGLLIDTVGRIPLLIFSSVFMSLALACFGSYIYYEQANKLITNSFSLDATASTNTDWIPLLCVLVFTIAFSIGMIAQIAYILDLLLNLLLNTHFSQVYHQSHRFWLVNCFR